MHATTTTVSRTDRLRALAVRLGYVKDRFRDRYDGTEDRAERSRLAERHHVAYGRFLAVSDRLPASDD